MIFEKIKSFQYPDTRKKLMSFIGLTTTLKRVTPLSVGPLMVTLLEPVSSKIKFEFLDKHKQAFDEVKQKLISTPLFCNLIDPAADKLIFSDASQYALGSVLLSRISNTSQELMRSHISSIYVLNSRAI